MSSTPSLADASQVDLWLARDAQLRDPVLLGKFASVLSAEERARVDGMQFEAGRHQQLVARAMVRSVLSHYLPRVAPAAWCFERGEHGRPSVARDMDDEARALHFNLAHTAGLVVMAVGRMPHIGVDVERADERVNLAVARRYFSPVEADALEALAESDRKRRFQRLWTLKEAYLKAIGSGIVGGLGSMTFHFETDGLRFERAADLQAASWVFREIEVEGFLIALAVETADGSPVSVKALDYLP